MAAADTIETGKPTAHGYRAVWRWHFFAALWTAPFLIVLTLTGAIYLFDREIDGWWNRDIQTIEPGASTLPLATQEAAVRAAYPGATVNRVVLPRQDQEAALWNITPEAEPGLKNTPVDVYLDPFSGTVTGTADPGSQPMTIVRDLHGNLMGGDAGSHIVELVACWTLVMMATGLWLWWPRTWKWKGVFAPRLSASGRRFWRDLHAIPAMFNALLVIGLVMTGLPWSAFWGTQFAKLSDYSPFTATSPNFKAPPKAGGALADDLHAQHAMPDAEDNKVPWVIKHSQQPHGSGHHAMTSIADIEKLLPELETAKYGGGVRISYPRDATGIFMISYVPDKAEGQRTIYVDPGTGRLLGNIGWREYSPLAKAVEWGTMTHMGRQYGLVNQLANLAVCLLLIGSVVAGLILWWRRRPKGTLAAPALKAEDRMPGGVKALLITLALLFPLVGATMIPVLAWSWVRR